MHAAPKKSRPRQDTSGPCSSVEQPGVSRVDEPEDSSLNDFNIQFADMALGPQQRTTFKEILLTICPFWISHFKRKK